MSKTRTYVEPAIEAERRWQAIRMRLAHDERIVIAAALQFAADQYDADARANHESGHKRVAEQFELQAKAARMIACMVEL